MGPIERTRAQIESDLEAAYGELARPSYAFAAERLEAGMHGETVTRLAQEFDWEDRTSIGSDDVCISLWLRPKDTSGPWQWRVLLSLVGNYAVVDRLIEPSKDWPVIEAHGDGPEAVLLSTLRGSGFELLPSSELREPTALRPANSDPSEVYTVYNALFSDAVPHPT
ncbi:MAG: hypothetical protein FWD17_10560 [Polyangiaceae bacterium]|nr:hypothetical protein [Polyangiaceae bacterium]